MMKLRKIIFILSLFLLSIFLGIFYYSYEYKKQSILLKEEIENYVEFEKKEYMLYWFTDKKNSEWKISLENNPKEVLNSLIQEWVKWVNQEYKLNLNLDEMVYAKSNTGLIIIFNNNFFDFCENSEQEWLRLWSLFQTLKQYDQSIISLFIFKNNEIQNPNYLSTSVYYQINMKTIINKLEKNTKKYNNIYFLPFLKESSKGNKIIKIYERAVFLSIFENKKKENILLPSKEHPLDKIKFYLNKTPNAALIGLTFYESNTPSIKIIRYPFLKKERIDSIKLIDKNDLALEMANESAIFQENYYTFFSQRLPKWKVEKEYRAHNLFDFLACPSIIIEIGISSKEDIQTLKLIDIS